MWNRPPAPSLTERKDESSQTSYHQMLAKLAACEARLEEEIDGRSFFEGRNWCKELDWAFIRWMLLSSIVLLIWDLGEVGYMMVAPNSYVTRFESQEDWNRHNRTLSIVNAIVLYPILIRLLCLCIPCAQGPIGADEVGRGRFDRYNIHQFPNSLAMIKESFPGIEIEEATTVHSIRIQILQTRNRLSRLRTDHLVSREDADIRPSVAAQSAVIDVAGENVPVRLLPPPTVAMNAVVIDAHQPNLVAVPVPTESQLGDDADEEDPLLEKKDLQEESIRPGAWL